jgi:DNA-binding FrmR family transcriptional regulator
MSPSDAAEAGSASRGFVAAPSPPYGYIAAEDQQALLRRMHRIEGQTRGIARMIAEDRYCIDILTQIAAVTTALESVAEILLGDHVRHCVARALASGDPETASAAVDELLAAVHRLVRTR